MDALLGEDLGDSLVGEGVIGVFGGENFLNHLLDAQGRFEEDFERDSFSR